ncbi:MAG TPA: cytochrome c3 family protein [Vicinamibacterales bacterium]|nr:cytochrome c3 family protein [Vicinamibacterales bacterium]
MSSRSGRVLLLLVSLVLLAVLAGNIGCRLLDEDTPASQAPELLPGQRGGVFTPAHTTFGSAVNDFFGRRPVPQQPLEFPHNIHIERGMTCMQACHVGVTRGPIAGLPSVRTCMACHRTFAREAPLIQQITELQAQGLDLDWQRVYGYPRQAHVRFDHAPHIRAKVDCTTCHGDVAQQTVAQRNVNLTMGFCVSCHQENNASLDCLTCHF